MEEENVQVVLRLRPLSEKERRQGEENVWKVYEGMSVVLRREVEDHLPVRKYTQSNSAFNFDRCFGATTTNEMVYESTVKGMVDSAVNGINATVFMYGQTGSGKTFTMLGYDQKKGVYNKSLAQDAKRSKSQTKPRDAAPEISFEQKMKQHIASEEAMADTQLENKTGLLIQALKNLFVKIKSSEDKTFFVKCSYVEIYNDQIYDLLQRAENISDTLQVCEDTAKDQFYIRGVREEAIDDWSDAIEKLKRGEVNRHYARTVMNHSSSRSHTIFRVYIQSLVSSWNTKGEASASPAYVTESWFNFVDLAGSEKVSSHDQVEEGNKLELRVKEGKSINKSLFFLTQVIKLKSEGKKTHIPYRNSPLTKILRSSLGGNSRTTVVLCVSPTYSHLEQTISTIRFGLSAKKIQNKISANVITRNDDEAVKIMIADYEKKLRDNEKDRELLREKEKKLLKKITDLESKTVNWAKKMKATQNLKFIDVTASIPEKDFENVLMDYQKYRVAHMDEAGLIDFPQKSQSKYSEFCKLMRDKVIDALRYDHGKFGDFDHECLNRAYHTPSGQLAMSQLEKLKNTVDTDLALYKKIQENWQKLNLEANFVYLVEQIQSLSRVARHNIVKVEQLSSLCEDEALSSKMIRKEKDYSEGKLNLSDLSDDDFERFAKKRESLATRIAAERKRRETAATIREAASKANIEGEVLDQLIAALPRDEFIPELNEEEEAIEAAQTAYLDKIRAQCKHDTAAIIEFESLEGPTQQEMSELVFKGCEEILAQRTNFASYHTENWKEFMKKLDEHQSQMKELYQTKVRHLEDVSKKGIKDEESIKGVWLDVDQILEQNKAQEQTEDNDTMSVSQLSISQVSKRPRRKQQDQTNASNNDSEKSLESETEDDGRGRHQRSDSLEGPSFKRKQETFIDQETERDEDEVDYDENDLENVDQASVSDTDPDQILFRRLPNSLPKGSRSPHAVNTPKMSLEGLNPVEKSGQSKDESFNKGTFPIKSKGVGDSNSPSFAKQSSPVVPYEYKAAPVRQKTTVDRVAQSPKPSKVDAGAIPGKLRESIGDKCSRGKEISQSTAALGTTRSGSSRSISSKVVTDREKSPTFGGSRVKQEELGKFESLSFVTAKNVNINSVSGESRNKSIVSSEVLHESILSVSSKVSTSKPNKLDDSVAELLKAKALDLKANQRRGRADRVTKKSEDEDE